MTQALLDQWNEFTEWKAILKVLPPMAVATIANEAIDLERERVASAQLHFWNAVIDYLMFAAHLVPDMEDDRRAWYLGYVEHLQAFVRSRWGDDPDILKAVEEAWAYSLASSKKLEPTRDALLERGIINRSGQFIANSSEVDS
ncbi:hypothetical protein LJR235_005370 [Pararhizobium sp. LjRoot235]|uniref:hypothetical protein n=1 Tax=Pararhizobium sp. LjRoot235 TaxID=3342291 RepID=UPI003ED02E63